MNSLKAVRRAKNEYLMQTWKMLFVEQQVIPAHRKLTGVRGTLIAYAKWLTCVPVIFRIAASLCGKTCHRAVIIGALPDRYPEFPVWLKKCWGITIIRNVLPHGEHYEEADAAELLQNTGCDTVLLIDGDPGCVFYQMIEKCARENGIGVIYVEQEPARGKYLLRRDMRKCVNNYMSVVLGEDPLRADIVNKDSIYTNI